MSDDSTPRKTLSLSATKRSTAQRPAKTGARARQVALNARQTQAQIGMKQALQKQALRRDSLQKRPSTPKATKAHTASATIQTSSYHEERFKVFARCPTGLEAALAQELYRLGFVNAYAGHAGCHFQTDWTGVMKANLHSRLASRILVQVAQASVHDEEELYELTRQVPWERWFGAEQTLRVDTSARRSPMKSLQYCNLRCKDAIVDRLRDKEGARPSIDTIRPDAKVQLFLEAQTATLYLDTSGESLFKRGWRYDKGQAPLRENLAAGLLALSGWTPEKPLYDPFCGSGTLLIEAAWIAQGIAPGIARPFAFERLRDLPKQAWIDLKGQALDAIRPLPDSLLFGSDIDPLVIAAARSNLQRAKLDMDMVHFQVGNALSQIPPSTQAGYIITNPPYGERLEAEPDAFWQSWSSLLKKHFSDWQVYVITSDLNLPSLLRLKPKRRTPLFNGDLECRLFHFEMVREQYRK